MKNKYFIANIVLTILVSICWVLDAIFIGVMFYMKNEYQTYKDYPDSYLEIERVEAEPVTTEDKMLELTSGYELYEIQVVVKNSGDAEYQTQYLNVYLEGKEIDDLLEIREEEENLDAPLAYDNQEIIPSGRTVQVKYVVVVKTGVEAIDAYIRLNNEDGYTIEIPL